MGRAMGRGEADGGAAVESDVVGEREAFIRNSQDWSVGAPCAGALGQILDVGLFCFGGMTRSFVGADVFVLTPPKKIGVVFKGPAYQRCSKTCLADE